MALKRLKNRRGRRVSFLSDEDRRRRKRELIIIAVIIALAAGLTWLEGRLIQFGPDFPVSNAILMFILININLLLLLFLIFLVFRNLVKLLYERRRRVMGAKLRTRLVIAFVSLTLMTTTVLFFFSIHFITNSIEFWFNVPVEQALDKSLSVGRELYANIESRHLHYLDKIAYQVSSRNYLEPDQRQELQRYFQVVLREFDFQGVEAYVRGGRRLAFSAGKDLMETGFGPVTGADLIRHAKTSDNRTLTETTPAGELNRTVGTVPPGVPAREARGFVVLTTLVSPELTENLAAIARGFEEYQQIKLLKRPIQVTYYITLSIVALLVLFCAVWFGFYLAKTISIPIKELADGTRRVADGDLSFSIPHVGDDEIGSLVESFNTMTRELRANRQELERSARMLRARNIEIEARRQYMEIVLRNVSTGVITLDARGFVTTVNTSAEKMLGIQPRMILRKSYKKLLGEEYLHLADEVMGRMASTRKTAVEMPLRLTISGRPRSFLMQANALRDDAGNHMGMVMVFDDLTDRERAQRMAAWREVARRIAHEVKNPLTPISLSAQRLKRRYSERIDDAVFDECTRMIIDHVELIRNLVNEFSRFARFPAANPAPCPLPPIIEETVALYREAHPEVTFETRISDSMVILNLDRQHIKQALINLVDNAVAAMRQQGKMTITADHDPARKIIRLELADTGPGISDGDKTRLFEPYFSTKKTGMGLGLTIVSSIVADHKGTIRVEDSSPGGAKFVIELPVTP